MQKDQISISNNVQSSPMKAHNTNTNINIQTQQNSQMPTNLNLKTPLPNSNPSALQQQQQPPSLPQKINQSQSPKILQTIVQKQPNNSSKSNNYSNTVKYKTKFNTKNGNNNNNMTSIGNKNKIQRLLTQMPIASTAYGTNYAKIYGVGNNANNHTYTSIQTSMQKQKESKQKSKNKKPAPRYSNANKSLLISMPVSSPPTLISTSLLASIPSSAQNTNNINSSMLYNKYHKPPLTKQELYEENLQLKAIVNQLKDMLSKQRIQTQLQKKKNKKYTVKLGRQFKKDVYYQYSNSGTKISNQQQPQDPNNWTSLANIQLDSQPQYQLQDSQSPSLQKLSKLYNLSPSPSPTKQKQKQPVLPPSIPSLQPPNPHNPQYMIAGIKNRYEELRMENQALLAQLGKYKAMDSVNKLQEISVYCHVLQDSNKKLAQRIRSLTFKLQSYQSNPQLTPNEPLANTSTIIQLTQQLLTLKAKHHNLKQSHKNLLQSHKEDTKTISYLQSLIISNSNNHFHLTLENKKLGKVNNRLQRQLQREREDGLAVKEGYIRELGELRERGRREMDRQVAIYEEAIVERNGQIKKLEKQNGYLTTILEHWRSGSDQKLSLQQQANKIKNKKKRKQSTLSNNFSVVSRQAKLQSSDKNIQPAFVQTPLTKLTERRQFERQYQSKINQMASMTNRNSIIEQNQTTKQSGKKTQKILNSNNFQRKKKSSAVKNSENSKKTRKVHPEHISDLPQYLRYRLIGLNMQIQQACRFIDYRPLSQENQHDDLRNSSISMNSQKQLQQIQKWKKKYITFIQLKAIFLDEPFKLKEDDAVLLARYITQDQFFYENGDNNNGYVYFDVNNQIERVVAKSILKAFIQTFSTNLLQNDNTHPSKYQQCQQQWIKIASKNSNRLNTALISIAPQGCITKQRWNQLLQSIASNTGTEINEDVKEWCIGKMMTASEGLTRLKYRTIVPEE